MINRVVLVGRLTRDVDLRYTQAGNAAGTFSLAVNRQFTNANGDRKADFINCVIWRKPAENLSNFTHKGSLIGIDGRLQTRNYESKEGQRVYVTEVVVDNFSLLESKASGEASDTQSAPNRTQNKPQQNNQSDPFANTGQAVDISDDDLPF
ncbi:single-stranded DNA-binding protein [Latilactobacillus sakei]|uniref:single-stranded DNA-binding protein n=1 Tax=Latilactobacillus sakei TaxID=1599 RepID=UPI000FFB8097|nr:single-stranded DNA-binding protein [Latilactobacillus sakei]RXA82592.1 single-stranded DNA-binding protein [Latilactobacillus sakei]